MAWSPTSVPSGWKTARPTAPIPNVSSDPWEEAVDEYIWRNASGTFSSALGKLRDRKEIHTIVQVHCGVVTLPQELDHLVNAATRIWYDCLLDQVQAECTWDKDLTHPYRLKLKPWQQQIKDVFVEHQRLLGDAAVKDKTLMMEPKYEIAVLLDGQRLPDQTPRQLSSYASSKSLHIADDIQNRQNKLSQAIMNVFPDYPQGLAAFTHPGISAGAATPRPTASGATVTTPATPITPITPITPATPATSTPPTPLNPTASLPVPRPKQDSLNMHNLQHSLPQPVGRTGIAKPQPTGPSVSQASQSTSADPGQTSSAGLEDNAEHDFNAEGMTLNELREIRAAPPEEKRKNDMAGLEELSTFFPDARPPCTSHLRRLSIQARTTHVREAIIKYMQDTRETGCKDEE